MKRVKALLEQIGLEPARVEMFNMSAAMAGEFVARATEMSERIAGLGPNPLRAPAVTTSASVDGPEKPHGE